MGEGCFKLHGYPEWWEEHKQRRAATKATVSRTGGKANLATLPNDNEPLQINTTEQLSGNQAINIHGSRKEKKKWRTVYKGKRRRSRGERNDYFKK